MRPASKSAAPAPAARKAMPPQPKHAPPPPPPAHAVPAAPAPAPAAAASVAKGKAGKFPAAPVSSAAAKSPLLHSPKVAAPSPSFGIKDPKFDFEEDSPPDHSPLSDPEPAEIAAELSSPSPKPGKTAFAKGKTFGGVGSAKKIGVAIVTEEVPGILKAAAALSPRHGIKKKKVSLDSIDSSSDFGVPPPPPPEMEEDDDVVKYQSGTAVSPFTDSSTLVSEFTYHEARFQKPYDLWTQAESEPDKFGRDVRAASSITGHSDVLMKSPKKFVPVPLHSPPSATPLSPAVLRSREGSGTSIGLDGGLAHLIEKGKMDVSGDSDREPVPGGGVKRRSFWDALAEAQAEPLGSAPSPSAPLTVASVPAPLIVSPAAKTGREFISPASPRRPIPGTRPGPSQSVFSRDASEVGGSTVADLEEAAQALRSPAFPVLSDEELDETKAAEKAIKSAEARKKAAYDPERMEVLDLGKTFGSTSSKITTATAPHGSDEVSDPKRVKVVYRTKSGPGKGSVVEASKDPIRAPVTRTSSSSIGSPDSEVEKHKHLKRLLSRPEKVPDVTLSSESSDPLVSAARPSVSSKTLEEKNAALLSGFKIVKRESRRGTGLGAGATAGSAISGVEGRRGTASGTGDRKALAAAAELGAIPEKKKVDGSGAVAHRLARYRTEPIKKKKFSNDLSGSEDESLVPQRGLVAVEDSDPKKKVKKVRAEEPPSP